MKEKIIKKLVDQLAETNNTIDLGAYEKGLRDMYSELNRLISFDWFEISDDDEND